MAFLRRKKKAYLPIHPTSRRRRKSPGETCTWKHKPKAPLLLGLRTRVGRAGRPCRGQLTQTARRERLAPVSRRGRSHARVFPSGRMGVLSPKLRNSYLGGSHTLEVALARFKPPPVQKGASAFHRTRRQERSLPPPPQPPPSQAGPAPGPAPGPAGAPVEGLWMPPSRRPRRGPRLPTPDAVPPTTNPAPYRPLLADPGAH